MDRLATCPTCAQPVRLTHEELIDKRGFCALCDTRFDITEHVLAGSPLPFREEAVVALTPIAAQPPTTRMRDRSSDGRIQVLVLPHMRALGLFYGLFATFWFGFLGFWVAMAPVFMKLFAIPFIIAGGFILKMCLYALTGREEVTLDGTELVRVRTIAGISRRVAMARRDVTDVRAEDVVARSKNGTSVSHVVKVIGAGHDSLVLGNDAGQPREALEWLAARLREGLKR